MKYTCRCDVRPHRAQSKRMIQNIVAVSWEGCPVDVLETYIGSVFEHVQTWGWHFHGP